MKLLVVMSDLFFSATVIGIAKKFGMSVELVSDRALVADKVRAGASAVIFDLNFAAADPVDLICRIKQDPATARTLLIGFVSHVQVELKARALEAGCDEVLARSVFVQKLPEILSRQRTEDVTARN